MVHTDRAPPQACPYGIGEPSSCPYCRQDADPGECQIVAVMRPGGWKLRSAFDMPKDGQVVEVIRLATPVDRARTLIEHYNTVSLREGGATWAGISATAAGPGQKVELLAMSPKD